MTDLREEIETQYDMDEARATYEKLKNLKAFQYHLSFGDLKPADAQRYGFTPEQAAKFNTALQYGRTVDNKNTLSGGISDALSNQGIQSKTSQQGADTVIEVVPPRK